MPFAADDERCPVILSACRTPVGRYGGALASVRPDDLAALVVGEAVRRAGVQPEDVDDVVLGAANQSGEDNRDVARMAVLLAGLPQSVAGQTVNRLCGSGLQAIVTSGHAIAAGDGELFVAGGVESMSRAPMVLAKAERGFDRAQQLYDTTLGWRFENPALAQLFPLESMGETGENVAEQYPEVASREAQDAFALESQRRWKAAHDAGAFSEETVPVRVRARAGETLVETDEHPRPETTAEALAKLRPAFREGGTVTAGNASGVNDGAAAVVVASADYAKRHGLHPRARLVSSAVAGVDPRTMGLGPIPASRLALERAGLSPADIDLVELNEAFASQALACMHELGLDPSKVNVNGGSIAMGHPLGSTGARLTTTLLHSLERRDLRYGLVTMCIGVGQGIAAVIERL